MSADAFAVDVEEMEREVEDDAPAPMRQRMAATLQLLRSRQFCENVLDAYQHRCALCGTQLRLLDAAHILPVAHPESTDRVNNGIALCALHHRAYDRGLVTFNEAYCIYLNDRALGKLSEDGYGCGHEAFAAALRGSLLLPQARASHPSSEIIIKANDLRGWR